MPHVNTLHIARTAARYSIKYREILETLPPKWMKLCAITGAGPMILTPCPYDPITGAGPPGRKHRFCEQKSVFRCCNRRKPWGGQSDTNSSIARPPFGLSCAPYDLSGALGRPVRHNF